MYGLNWSSAKNDDSGPQTIAADKATNVATMAPVGVSDLLQNNLEI